MEINSVKVQQYFEQVKPSIMGPYMMEGFGFPESAGAYRFQKETKIVESLLQHIDHLDNALDLGSGVGFWTEWLAERFRHVDSVESSKPFFQALTDRCSPYDNVSTYHGNALDFRPDSPLNFAFMGGLLMYLGDSDCVSLLTKLGKSMSPGGLLLCRESTMRHVSEHREGDYNVLYRTPEHYQRLFLAADLEIVEQQKNTAYELLQIGCELVRNWKRLAPSRFQALPAVGAATYWMLRTTAPLLQKSLELSGFSFPVLQNHFFLLRPLSKKASENGIK